ncbi:MAG: sensor hybrid histidine kinase [Thermoleophilia bacterium]|nr:sensor hybrid histidine kinase [Thermoleophilia bacterium]
MTVAPRILLVDDDAAARRMMRRVLERAGYLVEEAGDGRTGLDAALDDRPALVLLDLRMPGELSGFDVARALRADARTATLPIVVVSASTMHDARSLASSIGCDAFLEKPVDFDELNGLLASLAPQGDTTGS